MSNFKVGIMLDSLRLGFERGIDKAAEIGADGFQMYYCRKEPTPKDEIAFQRSYIEKNGLYVAAICGDIGPYSDESQHASRFEIMENVFNYTHELGANVVTGHIGWIPADKDHPQYRAIHKGMLTKPARKPQRSCVPSLMISRVASVSTSTPLTLSWARIPPTVRTA